MKLSVVLTIFNGEKYLAGLLESVRCQSRAPDQVILLDDGSGDASPDIARGFIERYRLDRWTLIRNEENLGWKKNFKKGFDAADGDLIFPCDQDDVWHPDKLKTMERCMEAHPELELAASNFDVVYEDRKHRKNYDALVRSMRRMKPGSLWEVPMDRNWIMVRRPGCTFCFRKTFYRGIRPFWRGDWAHDANLWHFACADGRLAIYAEPLITFRRHEGSATDRDGRGRTMRADACAYYMEVIETIRTYMESRRILTYATSAMMSRQMRFQACRRDFLSSGNPKYLLRLALRYLPYYYTFRNFLGDVYYAWLRPERRR